MVFDFLHLKHFFNLNLFVIGQKYPILVGYAFNRIRVQYLYIYENRSVMVITKSLSKYIFNQNWICSARCFACSIQLFSYILPFYNKSLIQHKQTAIQHCITALKFLENKISSHQFQYKEILEISMQLVFTQCTQQHIVLLNQM